MTWLHFAAPVLALAALYTAHRGGLCFGCAAVLLDKAGPGPDAKKDRLQAFAPLVEGYGYALLTVALGLAAGFVAGRVL